MSAITAQHRSALQDTDDWLWGIVAGNFSDKPLSTSQIVVSGIVTMIPGIDQIADVRDVIGSLFKMSSEAGRTPENQIEFAFTLIGLVPTFGSAGRMALRLVFEGKTLKEGMAVLHAFLPGNALDWFKRLDWAKLGTESRHAMQKAVTLLERVAKDLKQHNKGLTGHFIPDEIVVKAEAVASLAKRTANEIAPKLDDTFKTIKIKLDDAIARHKPDQHSAVVLSPNPSLKPQRIPSKKNKGLFCENKAYAYMVMMGYTLLSVDLDIPQGLDGVFEHDGNSPGRNVPKTVVFDPVSSTPPPYPKYVVLEAKYDNDSRPGTSRKGKLKKTKSGRQGSRQYIRGDRLDKAVGKEKADEIKAFKGEGPRKGMVSWLFVCLALQAVMFIDIAKKYPDVYASKNTGKLRKKPTPKQ